MSSSLPLERIYGTIYGNCIGDAIGLLTEFMTKDEARHHYHRADWSMEYRDKVHDSHRSRWKNGDWTDDSDQMILMMKSIIDQDGQVVAKDYGQKIKRWAREGFPELGDTAGVGLGMTTDYVLRHEEFDENPHLAADHVWRLTGCSAAPNGAVMRTSLMGIYQYQDLEKVTRNTLEFCKVTHVDYRCQASCVAVTTALALMLQGKHMGTGDYFDVEAIMDESFERAKKLIPEGKHQKEYIEDLRFHMYAESIKDLKLDDPNSIGYTYKALGAGFWAFRQYDFRQALQAVAMEAGDADTNGAVAGALLGCKLGVLGLPESWLYGLVHKKWLDEQITRFLGFAFRGSFKPGQEPKSADVMVKSNPMMEGNMSRTSEHHKLTTDEPSENPMKIPRPKVVSARGQAMSPRPETQRREEGNSSYGTQRPRGEEVASNLTSNAPNSTRSEGMAGLKAQVQWGGDSTPKRKTTITCSYGKLCDWFIDSLNLKDVLFDSQHDKCFCTDCTRGKEPTYGRGNPPEVYILPKGWCRFGLRIPAQAEEVFSDWHVAYQGITVEQIQDRLESNLHFLDQRMNGSHLGASKSHSTESGESHKKSDTQLFYVYPSILCATGGEHTKIRRWTDPTYDRKHHIQVALQVRIKPGSYSDGGNEFKGAGKPPTDQTTDGRVWATQNRDNIIVTGILVKQETPPAAY